SRCGVARPRSDAGHTSPRRRTPLDPRRESAAPRLPGRCAPPHSREDSAMRAPLAALAFLVALLAGALPARAQITTVDGGATLESYSFGSGFGVESLHQLSVPLVVEGRIGSRSTLTLATGWTR